MKKNKYNPSGKPVLTGRAKKGQFQKTIAQNVKRLKAGRKK